MICFQLGLKQSYFFALVRKRAVCERKSWSVREIDEWYWGQEVFPGDLVMIGASFINIRLFLLSDGPLDFCWEESWVVLTKNIPVGRFLQWKIHVQHQCRKQKFLPHTVSRKKTPIADTSNEYLLQTYERFFNIEVSIYIASAKSELNLQQLKSFHMLLKMLEMTFPRTKRSKFPGGACPWTPLDTPAFARRFFQTLSLNPRSAPELWGPFLS